MDKRSNHFIVRGLVLLTLVIGAVYLYQAYGDQLSLENLATREAALREYQTNHPVLVYGIAFAIYVLVTGLSLPGATALSLTYGWYFGFWRCLVLVSFASTTGATVAFLLSRFLFRDAMLNRFGDRLTKFNESLEREGAYYLFTLRLIPAVPFFVINVVMGLTPMRTSTYWWISQIGMLPGTIVYVFAGSQFPDLATLADQGVKGILTPQLLAAFVALGLFPLVAKKLLAKVKRPSVET